MKKILEIIKKERKVVENFSFLSILQISQLLIGFLVFPYLIKTLGSKNYGVLAYAQVIVSFLILVVNYGFNATATKQIAFEFKNKNFKNINNVINAVFGAKILLSVLSLIILFIVVVNISFMYEYKNIYFYTALSLIGWIMYPEWYFQGIEKMKHITYSMLVSKLLSLMMIFYFIKQPTDFYKVPIINSLSIILAGIIGVFLLKRSIISFKFELVNKKQILFQYKMGFSYFLSNITANAKDYFSTVLIGVFLNYKDVAIFDLANKIIKVLVVPCSILARAIFPKISVIKSKDYNKKIERLLLGYTLIILVIVFIVPNTMFSFIINENTSAFKMVLRILSLTLPLLALANSRGFLGLVAFGRDSKFMVGILSSVIVYVFVIILLITFNTLNTVTVSLSILLSLLIEVLFHSFYLKKVYEEN